MARKQEADDLKKRSYTIDEINNIVINCPEEMAIDVILQNRYASTEKEARRIYCQVSGKKDP